MRHLLSAADLSAVEVSRILDLAEEMAKVQDRPVKKLPALRGRTVVNLFFEDSTRTRSSFEIAGKWLSADVINISAKGSSVSKGESLRDTVLTVAAMGVDALVIRHHASGAPWQAAAWVDAHILNAGDGTHEHPTQALLDAFTLRRHFRLTEPERPRLPGAHHRDRRATSPTRGSRAATSALLRTLGARGDLGGAADPAARRRGQLAGDGEQRSGRCAADRRRRDDAPRAARADVGRVLSHAPGSTRSATA